MTATGAENLGDELITLCEIKALREKNTHTNIILFSHSPARTWRFFRSQNIAEKNLIILPYFPTNIRKNPLKNIVYFFQTLKVIRQSNHTYIGGGGLLYSISEEWHSPLRLWWMRAKIIKFFKKPLTYLSLGVSTKKEELQKYAHGLFQWATITVRDTESQKKIQEVGYKSSIKQDPVFEYTFQKTKMTKNKHTIGMALRSGFLSDTLVKNIIQTLLKKNYHIILLPHSLHPDDEKAHDGYYLQKFLLPGVSITQTIEQTLAAYTMCDCIVGMRLHSIILASVGNIPLIAISYGAKTRAILREMWQNFLDAKEVTTENICQKIWSILESKLVT